MLYSDFLETLGKCGLTVRAFAELVGMNPNSISNYARKGEVPTHLALISTLINELHALGGDYKAAIQNLEITPKRPRGGAREGHFGGDRQDVLDLKT